MILLPQIARWVSTIGVILMCFSLALSSFSTSVTHLILSQGIGFGVGGSLAYTPSILFMPEWFVKRKGLAFGVVWVSFHTCQVWAKAIILMWLSVVWLWTIWRAVPTRHRVVIEQIRCTNHIENIISWIVSPFYSVFILSSAAHSSFPLCCSTPDQLSLSLQQSISHLPNW